MSKKIMKKILLTPLVSSFLLGTVTLYDATAQEESSTEKSSSSNSMLNLKNGSTASTSGHKLNTQSNTDTNKVMSKQTQPKSLNPGEPRNNVESNSASPNKNVTTK